METKILKDGFDYVFIDSGSPDSYLITNDVDNFYRNDTNVTIYGSNGSSSTGSSDTNTNDTLFNIFSNNSSNGTIFGLDRNVSDTSTEDIANLIQMAATSIVLGLMILITVIGNVFVIAAIILERNLQNVANYLVASLAVADLFVACLVMPLGAVYEISKGWILGPELCDIWTSCDVLCCTASILHLVAIATDRYWAVTNVDYMHSRTSKRVFTMIFLVWFASVVVSLAPQFGWKDPEYLERIEQQKCMVSQDIAYQVFATCCTFYVPLLVILVLYWKIYQTARKRIHRRRPRPIESTTNNNQPTPQKKKTRLKIRLAKKFTNQGKTAASSLGLVEGNSTNTVNTVEDTEFSSNVENNRKGLEITTTFNNNPQSSQQQQQQKPQNKRHNEVATSSTSQLSTVSHLVAANQINNENNGNIENNNQSATTTTVAAATTTTTTTTATITNQKLLTKSGSAGKLNDIDNNHSNNQMKLSTSSITIASVGNTAHATTSSKSSKDTEQQQPQQQIATISSQNLSTSAVIITTNSQQVTPLQQNKQNHPPTISSIPNPQTQVNKRKETLEAKRERKAAKTLAIITGAFVVCWLPFFLMAILLPLCASCHINDTIASFFLWLGYFNSTLNPVIYTIFSPEFRQAFKRILFGGHRPNHYRSGKI